jgi:hypothetical protein
VSLGYIVTWGEVEGGLGEPIYPVSETDIWGRLLQSRKVTRIGSCRMRLILRFHFLSLNIGSEEQRHILRPRLFLEALLLIVTMVS